MAEIKSSTPTCEKPVYELSPEQRGLLKMVAGTIQGVQEEAADDLSPDAAEILSLVHYCLMGVCQRRREPLHGEIMRARLGVDRG